MRSQRVPVKESKARRRDRLRICSDAVEKMQSALDDLSVRPDVGEDLKAVRKQLRRIERVCATIDGMNAEANHREESHSSVDFGGDPADVARELVSLIPLDEICRNHELMDAFLAQMFLAVANASSRKERRKRQAEGIAAARARGVHFGRRSPPLPENFDELHAAWRRGICKIKDAAEQCGMSESSFYRAALRSEEAEADGTVGVSRE